MSITGVILTQKAKNDREYIDLWSECLGVTDVWRLVQANIGLIE